jgi:hypothetical protein
MNDITLSKRELVEVLSWWHDISWLQGLDIGELYSMFKSYMH